MNNIKILDCTLRDGGYCNDWTFGKDSIRKILQGLDEANIDVVECGYLTRKEKKDSNRTQFVDIEQISEVFPLKTSNQMHVVMVNYGDYNFSELPQNSGAIDGIRVCFHKKNWEEALEACKVVQNKGYKAFVQPMLTSSYSDIEFITLIAEVNKIEPYAFYIVDSFGMMKEKELKRYFYILESDLSEKTIIGFHSHNNMQLAFSNCLSLIKIQTNRTVIIDSSVYGMGRGAGNLNTELIIEYLNNNKNANYELGPILGIIDDVLYEFYEKNYWGYSLPNYLSAKHNAHPKYARYLDEKKTLTIEKMEQIFALMDDEKKLSYDKTYIEKLYRSTMANEESNEDNLDDFISKISGKNILLIAPGKSSKVQREEIIEYSNNNDVISISVNFEYTYLKTDYLFVSNSRRYRDLKNKVENCIVTSNIEYNDSFLKVKYKDLLNEVDEVSDNAGLMIIQLLINCGASKIVLAGFDGYSHEVDQNYAENEQVLYAKSVLLDQKNVGFETVLKKYSEQIEIQFLTKSRYEL